MGKEMDGFGKRSQMPRISVSCSLQACILYSFSSFILAPTFLSVFCKPAQPSMKCVGTFHHRNPITVVKQSKSSSSRIFGIDVNARAAESTPCYTWTTPVQLVGGLRAHREVKTARATELTSPFHRHLRRSLVKL